MLLDMMRIGYIYVYVCCCERAGQIGKSGALKREGWREGRGYAEVAR
jgi:hypothetical protein